MKIHHFNCATLCPIGGRWIPGIPRTIVCHCLLIETSNGLVLVDTGLSTQDIQSPERLRRSFRTLIRPILFKEETALHQVKNLGFDPNDVRHIILTHLDLDHASGISDFPNAQVHVYSSEYVAAMAPATFMEKRRYSSKSLSHQVNWNLYSDQGDRWKGFESVQALEGLPPEILLIPLIGHSLGHCGVAIQNEGKWLLHAGDAYFHHEEISKTPPRAPLGIKLFQKLMQVDSESRIDNLMRLRELSQKEDVKIICSHDSCEFEEFQKK